MAVPRCPLSLTYSTPDLDAAADHTVSFVKQVITVEKSGFPQLLAIARESDLGSLVAPPGVGLRVRPGEGVEVFSFDVEYLEVKVRQ